MKTFAEPWRAVPIFTSILMRRVLPRSHLKWFSFITCKTPIR